MTEPDSTEARVSTFVPDSTNVSGTLDTSGTAGAAHEDINEVTTVFKDAEALNASTDTVLDVDLPQEEPVDATAEAVKAAEEALVAQEATAARVEADVKAKAEAEAEAAAAKVAEAEAAAQAEAAQAAAEAEAAAAVQAEAEATTENADAEVQATAEAEVIVEVEDGHTPDNPETPSFDGRDDDGKFESDDPEKPNPPAKKTTAKKK